VESIFSQLSSSVGDRTNAANHAVALACLDNPALLAQVAQGLLSQDERLAGDCAEVMTQTAAETPEAVLPYAGPLIMLLDHPFTRARWEAAHTLATIAPMISDHLRSKRGLLDRLIRTDPSIIVRDYTVDIVAGLAGASPEDAKWAFPLLLDCLHNRNGKHAGRALPGLGRVAEVMPDTRGVIRQHAESLSDHPRGGVRKAARRLTEALDRM
jgi:HPt (histidine-containing phosphotransfer) domain-containing protein